MDCTTRRGYRQHQELLQRELGQWAACREISLTPMHQRIVHTLDWLDLQVLLGQTKQLRERLLVDAPLRRLLGFEPCHKLPSEATFCRAFAQFAGMGLPARMHEALIRSHLAGSLIGHIARDSTAIAARERAAACVRAPKVTKRRGCRPAGEPPAAPRSRIPAQLLQTPEQALAELPKACNKGKKRDAHGNINAWIGYKLHLDVACCGVPITAALTSASVHDNQLSVPLARLSAQRVTSLSALMDAAYDSEALRALERDLGHVPIVAINGRGRSEPPTLDAAEKKRFGVRTVVERVNGRLKDSFACNSVWVKGHAKVLCHTMFAVLALSVDALMRLMLFEPVPQS